MNFFVFKGLYFLTNMYLWLLFLLVPNAKGQRRQVCTSGKYVYKDHCLPCQSGYYMTKTSHSEPACIQCGAGKYQNEQAQTMCEDCAVGKYADTYSLNTCKQCEMGQYQNEKGAPTCTDCPSGYFKEDRSSIDCKQCPRGWSQDKTEAKECQKCPQGYYQTDGGASECKHCVPGTYAYYDTNEYKCKNCPTGYFQDDIAKLLCKRCENNHDSKEQASECYECSNSECCSGWGLHASGTCQSCLPGQFQANSNQCEQCPVGFHSIHGSSLLGYESCEICESGRFAVKDRCELCSSGQYGVNGICLSCPSGYRSHIGQSLCTTSCNSYSRNDSNNSCETCTNGHYYPDESSGCVQCPNGWVKTQKLISQDGQCVECSDTMVNNTNNTRCETCPINQGKNSLKSCETCPTGQYRNLSDEECITCPGGWVGSVDSSNERCSKCEAGQYQNINECKECPKGYSQREGAMNYCEECKAGFVSDVNAMNCTTCTIKKPSNDIRTECSECQAGQEASSVAPFVCNDCKVGFYSTEGSNCTLCQIGKFQNVTGQGECISCPNGKNSSGDVGFSECYTGTFISAGSGLQNNNEVLCTAGTYSIGGVNAICKTCATGSYSVSPFKHCQQCGNGQYVQNQQCQQCPQGYAGTAGICDECYYGQYQDETNSVSCKVCDGLATTVTTGSTTCVNCTDSFEIIKDGQCANCPLGKVNSPEELCKPCAPGEEVVHKKCTECQIGKFIDITEEYYCQDCPVGYNSAAKSTECSLEMGGNTCASGYYFDLSCKKCPRGYGGSQQTRCIQCRAGKAQPSEGKSECIDCTIGQYSAANVNIHCELCQKGQFQHLSQQGDCNDCIGGSYADSLGHDLCKTCPLGKTSVNMKATRESDCQDCASGKFGVANGQCEECPESTWQNETGKSDCKKCVGENPMSKSGSIVETDCFDATNIVTFVFDVKDDSKQAEQYSSLCEIRPNMVLLCPACTCNDNSRDGYWDGPVCNECRHGFAGGGVGKCLIKCPGYDGVHDSTMCSGNGKCWFGKYGNGQCLCGGKNILDASSDNIVVNVKSCPVGQRCSGYDVLETAQYIPQYYILEYRQYSVFVLQLSSFTPINGHMWFERFSPTSIYENTCSMCLGSYDGTTDTEIGFFNKDNTYQLFNNDIQVKNGFHGENCQYECAVCVNNGHCLHTPHPFYYTYTIDSDFRNFKNVVLPQTQCICSSDMYDSDAMCCPVGFEPYVYFGKRKVEPYFQHSALPFISNIENTVQDYWTDEDLWMQNNKPKYSENEDGTIELSNINGIYSTTGSSIFIGEFSKYGPYTKHSFYGTEKEICRACPGLFGKGVVSRSVKIESEIDAEDFWWDSAAKGKKCNGLGVCDFYRQKSESDTLFMGEFKQTNSNTYELQKKFTGCGGEGTLVGDGTELYNDIDSCLQKSSKRSGYLMFSVPYKVAASNSILLTNSGVCQGWGYIESIEDTKKYCLNSTSIPIPDANGEYIFHPKDEGLCYHFDTCIQRQNNRYSIYKIGMTGEGDDRLQDSTFDRFDTCFTYDDGTFKTKLGNYVTETYVNGQDPFLGEECPVGHFCTATHDKATVGFKEACPAGYYQPYEAQTRTNPSIMCSRLYEGEETDSCQNNTATHTGADLVDKVCKRCKRNEYSKIGSNKCTACPQGRVKKISSITTDKDIFDLTMLNIPTQKKAKMTPWYYIDTETGDEKSDCALVPSGIIHIPLLDKEMTYNVAEFLPVIACPFGFSSRPGTYVISGYEKLATDISEMGRQNIAYIQAPYIQMTDGDNSIGAEYCYLCPTESMTSAGSMTCTTCYGNNLMLYLKDRLESLVSNPNELENWKQQDEQNQVLTSSIPEPIQLRRGEVHWSQVPAVFKKDGTGQLQEKDGIMVCDARFNNTWTGFAIHKEEQIVTCRAPSTPNSASVDTTQGYRPTIPEYIVITSGKCSLPIETAEECLDAAVKLHIQVGAVIQPCGTLYPFQNDVPDSVKWYNPHQSELPCSDTNNCICKYDKNNILAPKYVIVNNYLDIARNCETEGYDYIETKLDCQAAARDLGWYQSPINRFEGRLLEASLSQVTEGQFAKGCSLYMVSWEYEGHGTIHLAWNGHKRIDDTYGLRNGPRSQGQICKITTVAEPVDSVLLLNQGNWKPLVNYGFGKVGRIGCEGKGFITPPDVKTCALAARLLRDTFNTFEVSNFDIANSAFDTNLESEYGIKVLNSGPMTNSWPGCSIFDKKEIRFNAYNSLRAKDYQFVDKGKCLDDGLTPITTAKECFTLAQKLGKGSATSPYDYQGYPPGCVLVQDKLQDKLYLNTDKTSTTSCSSSYKCACKLGDGGIGNEDGATGNYYLGNYIGNMLSNYGDGVTCTKPIDCNGIVKTTGQICLTRGYETQFQIAELNVKADDYTFFEKVHLTKTPNWDMQYPLCAVCSPGYRTSSSKTCEGCQTGQYTSTMRESSSLNCIECPKGWFQSAVIQPNCKKCPTGEYQVDEGQSECTSCAEGRFNDIVGKDEVCTQCPAGYINTGTRHMCSICPAGKKENGQRTGCEDCSESESESVEYIAIHKGILSGCVMTEDDCSKYFSERKTSFMGGKYFPSGNDNRNIPHGCIYSTYGAEIPGSQPTNVFWNAVQTTTVYPKDYHGKICKITKTVATLPGSTDCKGCERGKYADEQKCEMCPSGYKGNQAGFPCVQCEAGKYQGALGETDCEGCPVGKYQDETGQDHCKACLENQNCQIKTTMEMCPATGYSRLAKGDSCLTCDDGDSHSQYCEQLSKCCFRRYVENTFSDPTHYPNEDEWDHMRKARTKSECSDADIIDPMYRLASGGGTAGRESTKWIKSPKWHRNGLSVENFYQSDFYLGYDLGATRAIICCPHDGVCSALTHQYSPQDYCNEKLEGSVAVRVDHARWSRLYPRVDCELWDV